MPIMNIRTIIANDAALTATDMNAVTEAGAPSKASGTHWWNGNAAILKNIPDATVIIATVEEINLEANTFKLKGPDGEVNEYTARNPENLKRSAVGDLVVITVTEAIAITVEEQMAE